VALSDTYYAFSSNEYLEEIKRMVFPTKTAFDSIYKRVVARVGSGKILDVGCGQGYILSGVKAPPSDLYGIDMETRAIEAAGNWVAGGSFCLADARSIPFKADAFDYLICTEVLEHIVHGDVVAECYRVLKPTGTALFTVPNGKGAAGKINPTHLRLFTSRSIVGILEAAGFEIITVEHFGLYIPFVSPFLELLLRASRRHLPISGFFDLDVPEFLATNFFIECRRPVGSDREAREKSIMPLAALRRDENGRAESVP
jgi:SAM-dependent methyltransferase